MSISFAKPNAGDVNWDVPVNANWQAIQGVLNCLVAQNILINGGFDFFQRSAPTSPTDFTNNSYWSDRWYFQHDGTTGVQIAPMEDGRYFIASSITHFDAYAEIKNASGENRGVLFSQTIESTNAIPLRSRKFTLQLSAYALSGSPVLKYRIYEWTGSRDNAFN